MFKDKKTIIKEEIEAGLHPTVIAEKYGFSLGSLYYHMKTLGIESNFGKQEKTKAKYSDRMKLRHLTGESSGEGHWTYGKLKVRDEFISEEEAKEELEYYLTLDLTIEKMAELTGIDDKSITNRLQKFGLQQGRRSGERHPDWKGGHSKYRGPDWYKQRRLALKRDNFTCQRCNIKLEELENPQFLHVHHIIPYQISQSNELNNLTTLCIYCHGMVEHETGIHSM